MSLAPQHAHLLESSAIAADVAAARGYRTVLDQAELAALGFSRAQRLAPGLLIPVHSVDGAVRTYQYRPDTPRLDPKGRPRKYEIPWQSRLVLDVPPAARGALGDPSVALWVTEGARKADAAVSAGLCCLSLAGVYGWRGTNSAGGRRRSPTGKAWRSTGAWSRRRG